MDKYKRKPLKIVDPSKIPEAYTSDKNSLWFRTNIAPQDYQKAPVYDRETTLKILENFIKSNEIKIKAVRDIALRRFKTTWVCGHWANFLFLNLRPDSKLLEASPHGVSMILNDIEVRLRIFFATMGYGHAANAVFVGERMTIGTKFNKAEVEKPDNWIIFDAMPEAGITPTLWKGEVIKWKGKVTLDASEQNSLDYTWKVSEHFIDIMHSYTPYPSNSKIASFKIVKKTVMTKVDVGKGRMIPVGALRYILQRKL